MEIPFNLCFNGIVCDHKTNKVLDTIKVFIIGSNGFRRVKLALSVNQELSSQSIKSIYLLIELAGLIRLDYVRLLP